MTQSMIGFVVALVALLIVGLMVVQHYKRDHPAGGINRWLDTHHINWMSHKPDTDQENDRLP